MKTYKALLESLPSTTVVFAFGRFNPPSIGHGLLVGVVKKLAEAHNADHVIYASKTQDAKKNPLSVDRKLHYLQLMFPKTNFVGASPTVRTPIEAAKELNKRYNHLIMVAGSDRLAAFTQLLNQYNGVEYNFSSIQVISAGERDPDADDATGMSASKLRLVASRGDFSEFKKGLPPTIREIDARRMMNDVRVGMGLESIKEQIKFNVPSLREQYFRGEIFNVGDSVVSNGVIFEVVKRGTNHLLVKDPSGTLSSKWINEVAEVK